MPPTVPQVAFPNPGSTPAGPSAPVEESIWTGILQSLGSSKAVLPRRLLVLGDPNSGKSVLVQNLKRDHRPFLQPPATTSNNNNTGSTSTSDHASTASQGLGSSSTDPSGGLAAVGRVEQSELALSYTYTDIRDEEDTVSRVGIYQLAASHPTLLPFALNADSLANTAVIIVLDWQRPWSWVESLQRWLSVLSDGVAHIAQEGQVQGGGPGGWSKGQVVVENAKEHLERFLQLYTEPSSSAATINTAPGADRDIAVDVGGGGGPGEDMGKEVLLPLPEGCLTHNLGLPIAVVCTKADGMRTLEREQDYRDEQFDHIQQSLRTLCLAYGASLFHTTTHRPRTFAMLRAYLLHRLLGPGSALVKVDPSMAGPTSSAPMSRSQSGEGEGDEGKDKILASSTPSKPTSLLFRYPYRAQVVERETVAVPSGWDTWGKIGILREGFQCRETLDGWEFDLVEEDRGHGSGVEGGLRQLYEQAIRDSSVGVRRDAKKEVIIAESEQDFLIRQQEALKRAKASAPAETHPSYGSSIGYTAGSANPGTLPTPAITPMNSALGTTTSAAAHSALMNGVGGTSTSILHGYRDGTGDDVEEGMGLGAEHDRASPGVASLLGGVGTTANPINAMPNSSATAAPSSSMAADGTPNPTASSGAAPSGNPASQNEVLANFFQSLLSKKTSTGPGTGPGAAGGDDGAVRHQAAEELDRMKQSRMG